MSRRPRLFALVIWGLSIICPPLHADRARAQYLYLQEDPRRAHAELINDFLAGAPRYLVSPPVQPRTLI